MNISSVPKPSHIVYFSYETQSQYAFNGGYSERNTSLIQFIQLVYVTHHFCMFL